MNSLRPRTHRLPWLASILPEAPRASIRSGCRDRRRIHRGGSDHERGLRGLRGAVLRDLRRPLPQVRLRLRPRRREEAAEAVRDPGRRAGV